MSDIGPGPFPWPGVNSISSAKFESRRPLTGMIHGDISMTPTDDVCHEALNSPLLVHKTSEATVCAHHMNATSTRDPSRIQEDLS